MQRLVYILIQTGRNLRQTWETQIMTLLTVTLSVLIFAFFFLVYTNMLQAGDRLGGGIRLVAFLDEEVLPQQQAGLAEKIRTFGEVEKIVFVSRAEAFSRLGDRLGNDRDVLDDLGAGFLPPSIEVYPKRTLRSLARIDLFSERLLELPGVAKVQYGKEWLSRFATFTGIMRTVVFASGGLLVAGMVFMVSYTIRLTVAARRHELEMLTLLGATSTYIRLPLLLEGVLQGLTGAGLGLGALYLFFLWVSRHIGEPGFLQLFAFVFFPPATTAAILLATIALCACGSLASIRRFLRT